MGGEFRAEVRILPANGALPPKARQGPWGYGLKPSWQPSTQQPRNCETRVTGSLHTSRDCHLVTGDHGV